MQNNNNNNKLVINQTENSTEIHSGRSWTVLVIGGQAFFRKKLWIFSVQGFSHESLGSTELFMNHVLDDVIFPEAHFNKHRTVCVFQSLWDLGGTSLLENAVM